MNLSCAYLWLILGAVVVVGVNAGCPAEAPIPFGPYCFALKYDFMRLSEAETTCAQLVDGAEVGTIPDSRVLTLLLPIIMQFIMDKSSKANYWVGMRAEPPPVPGEERESEERRWIFDIDESKVLEKDYELWDKTPSDALSCAIMKGVKNFQTVAVDCRGERLPVICEKKEGPCYDDNKLYLTYEQKCYAVISGRLEYNKIHGACSQEGVPAAPKNDQEKKLLMNAANNGFLGGVIFTSLAKQSDGSWAFRDGSQPKDEDWGEGEPNINFDCAGISLQLDWTLKYRTTNCNGMASFLCSYTSP